MAASIALAPSSKRLPGDTARCTAQSKKADASAVGANPPASFPIVARTMRSISSGTAGGAGCGPGFTVSACASEPIDAPAATGAILSRAAGPPSCRAGLCIGHPRFGALVSISPALHRGRPGWPDHQVVIDGPHTGRDLRKHVDGMLFRRRVDDAPQVDGSLENRDTDERGFCPRFAVEPGHHVLPDGGVIGLHVRHSIAQSRERLQQISAADDTDEPAVMNDRNAFDALTLQYRRELGNRRIRTGRDHIVRHDIGDPARMRLHVFGREGLVRGECLEPPRLVVACFVLGTIDEVALADDAEQLSAGTDHGNRADLIDQQQVGDLPNGGVRGSDDDVRNHHVGRFHGASSNVDAFHPMQSDRVIGIDLNQTSPPGRNRMWIHNGFGSFRRTIRRRCEIRAMITNSRTGALGEARWISTIPCFAWRWRSASAC